MGDYADDQLAYFHPEVFGNGQTRYRKSRNRVGHYPPETRKRNQMSGINPKNYDGSTVIIVGNAGSPVEVKNFDNGGSQAQLSIAVGKGYKKGDEWIDTGTDWYLLTATADYANDNWPDVQAGDKVRVDEARLEFKPYKKKDGEPGVEATLRYGTLVIVKAKTSTNSEVRPF